MVQEQTLIIYTIWVDCWHTNRCRFRTIAF